MIEGGGGSRDRAADRPCVRVSAYAIRSEDKGGGDREEIVGVERIDSWRTIRNERPAVVFFWSVTRLADRPMTGFSALRDAHRVQLPRRSQVRSRRCTVHFIDGRKTGPPRAA